MNTSKLVTLFVSWIVTAAVVGVAIAGGALAWGKSRAGQARVGWKLVPALTAARDLSEGTVLEARDLAARDLPEQLVTASVLRPGDQAGTVGKRLEVPMQQGDPMLRSHLEPRPVSPACASSAKATAKDLGLDDPQVRAFLDELQQAVDAAQPKKEAR